MIKKEAQRLELDKRKYIRGNFKELEEYREEVWHCNRCNMCKEVFGWYMKSAEFSPICPSFAFNKYDAYSAQGKMHIARALIEGEMEWEDSEELLRIIYSCDMCGGCTINCLRIMENNPLEVFRALRARAVENGLALPHHKRLFESTIKYDNPLGAPKDERLRWTEGLDFEIKDLKKERADVLLFTGCMYSLEPRVRDILKVIARVLKAAGADFGILGTEEKCCGSIQLLMGEAGMFEQLARDNINTFNELGIKTLVTPCAHCYNAFVNEYPEVGELHFEALHLVQYLDRLIEGGKIKLGELPREVVTLHDPCDLGRKSGVYESPRKVLNAITGVELREMERMKDQTWCCGGGGGLLEAYPEQSMWAAEERIKEARVTTGADTLVTACPWCEYSFKNAVEKTGVRMKINDVAEIVYRALKKEGE
ncbi:MAG: (Fe-S)-binding protein [Chloroflexota bacterium]